MQEFGTALLDDEQKTEIGIRNYDTIVIRSGFGAENPEVVAKFLKVTAELNASFTVNPARMIPNIANSLDMTEATVSASMERFRFPSVTAKLGTDWLGGEVQTHLKQLANFFVEQGTMNESLDSYSDSVDVSYLQKAAELPLIEAE